MSSAGGCPSWQTMVSVRNFHRSVRALPAARGHAGSSPAATTPQVTPSIHDFAVSLPRRRRGLRLCGSVRWCGGWYLRGARGGAAFVEGGGGGVPLLGALASELRGDACAVAWQVVCELRPLLQGRALQLEQTEEFSAAVAESQRRVPLQLLREERNARDRVSGPRFCAGGACGQGRGTRRGAARAGLRPGRSGLSLRSSRSRTSLAVDIEMPAARATSRSEAAGQAAMAWPARRRPSLPSTGWIRPSRPRRLFGRGLSAAERLMAATVLSDSPQDRAIARSDRPGRLARIRAAASFRVESLDPFLGDCGDREAAGTAHRLPCQRPNCAKSVA
jgi:hypothetical protein